MTTIDYTERAQLYLGRDWPTASAQGPRSFRTVRNALRFAFEHAAPVSLHGARLLVAGRTFAGTELKRLYRMGKAQPAH